MKRTVLFLTGLALIFVPPMFGAPWFAGPGILGFAFIAAVIIIQFAIERQHRS